MKKQILVIMLLLFNSLIVFIPVDIVRGDPNPSGGNIVGDTVWWENNYANLSVYPHTSTNIVRQKQWANLTWLASDNVIDIAFRFNDSLSYGKIWRWTGSTWSEVSMSHIEYGGKHYYYYIGFNVIKDTIYRFRWEYDVIANTNGKWWFFVKFNEHTIQQALDNNWYIALDPWWDSDWQKRVDVVIDKDYINGDLIDFPVLVNISADISQYCNNGDSIRFVNSGNDTEYAFEFNENFDGSTYNLIWVNVSFISSTIDTYFNMYFSNIYVSSNENPSGLWEINYTSVYHMGNAGSTITDSTSNSYDATSYNTVSQYDDVVYGLCQDFSTDGYIETDDAFFDLTDTTFSWSWWVYADNDIANYGQLATNSHHVHEDDASDYRGYIAAGSVLLYFDMDNGTNGWSTVVNDSTYLNEWHYIVFQRNGNDIYLFIDGMQRDTDTTTWTGSGTTKINMGRYYNDGWYAYLDGKLNEIRLSSSARSDAWINASYYTMTQTAGMITVSSIINRSLLVHTNETTNITETTATLNGYILSSDELNGNYDCGFWYGLNDPPTSSDTNVSSGSYPEDTEFDKDIIGLVEGTRYYVKAYISNSTFNDSDDVVRSFYTRPKSPTSLSVSIVDSDVNLVWTRETASSIAKSVVVKKNDSYPNDWSDSWGTLVYNDTDSSFIDASGYGTHWYYRVWNYIENFSVSYTEDNIMLPPLPPTDVNTNVLSNNTFDIIWTKGNGANTTVVRRKLNSYPSSITDGTQIYNDTGTQINIQDITDYYYYSLWSYANTTYSSSVNISVGGLVVSCFDEETNESLWFDVFISNQDGSQSYESLNNTNPLILNISQLPTGDDIKIVIGAASNYSEKSEISYWGVDENYTITYIVLSQVPDSKSSTNVTCINESDNAHSYPPFTLDGDLITILPDDADDFTKIFVNYTHEEYSSRLYYRDIDVSSFSFLNAYLPPTEDKQLYLLEVIDEADNTVQDAHIEVKRSVNGTYVIVSRLLTDANGQADINLISDRDYIFIISKDGYVTENASWTPGTLIFTHTFRIIWEVIPFEPDAFGDIISFYGTLYENNTMRVTFYDLDNGMSDSHFIVYEDYNNTLTYMGEYNGTTSNDIVFWINVTNATRLHVIVLYMNHSTLGEVVDYRIVVYPVHVDREGGTWLENLIVGVVGDFDYGYVLTLIWVLPCVLLVAGLGAIGHPGVGCLGAGLYSIWITWNITLPEEAKILTFASIAIVTGFITLVLVKGKKVIH